MKTKKRSRIQENKIAKEIEGKPVVGSGCLWAAKGDARNDKYLIEAKFTDLPTYKLDYKTWDKIRREAINDGLRIPVMQITIQNTEYALLRLEDLWSLAEDKDCVLELLQTNHANKSKSIIPYPFDLIGAENPNGIQCVTYKFGDNEALALIWWKDFKYIM